MLATMRATLWAAAGERSLFAGKDLELWPRGTGFGSPQGCA